MTMRLRSHEYVKTRLETKELQMSALRCQGLRTKGPLCGEPCRKLLARVPVESRGQGDLHIEIKCEACNHVNVFV